jgi:hypothetical protein
VAKIPWFSNYLLCFFFYNIREQEGGTGSAQRWGRGREKAAGEVSQIVYIHIK